MPYRKPLSKCNLTAEQGCQLHNQVQPSKAKQCSLGWKATDLQIGDLGVSLLLVLTSSLSILIC